MQVVAFCTPARPEWRWRIVNYSGEMVEESYKTFLSIAAAVTALAEGGVSAEDVDSLLQGLSIRPVFTAHPTEARRMTVLRHLRRIANQSARSRVGRAHKNVTRRTLAAGATEEPRPSFTPHPPFTLVVVPSSA